jgi:carbonic anhydrase
VRHIVVCGHSDCGAMHAHFAGVEKLPQGPLKQWLESGAIGDVKGLELNEASRRNVLNQLDHLRAYPSVSRAISAHGLRLHGLWFDIQHLDVLYYEEATQRWTVLNALDGPRILRQIDK